MSKRKLKMPVQLDSGKRSLMTWNMAEGNQQGPSASFLDTETTPDVPGCSSFTGQGNVKFIDDISSVRVESDNTSKTHVTSHHITQYQYTSLRMEAKHRLTVHEQLPQETVVCQLGLITLTLKPHQLSKTTELSLFKASRIEDETLPKLIPRGRFSLFINPTKPSHLVFEYARENAENAPKGFSTTTHMCMEATIAELPARSLEGLSGLCNHHKGKVKLTRHCYDSKTSQLSIAMCLLQPALTIPTFACEPGRHMWEYEYHMQNVMHWFHGFPASAPRDELTAKRHDFNQLFDAVRHCHVQNGDDSIAVATDLQHPSLVPTLRGYQCQAVSWMLKKERFGKGVEKGEELDGESGRLHCMWSQLNIDGQTLYYNYHSGKFTRVRFTQQPSTPGGILADEMGLGKTVEVLACILVHPRYPTVTVPEDNHDERMDAATGIAKVENVVKSPNSDLGLAQKKSGDSSSLLSGSDGGKSFPQTKEENAGRTEIKDSEPDVMDLNQGSTSEESKATDSVTLVTVSTDVEDAAPVCLSGKDAEDEILLGRKDCIRSGTTKSGDLEPHAVLPSASGIQGVEELRDHAYSLVGSESVISEMTSTSEGEKVPGTRSHIESESNNLTNTEPKSSSEREECISREVLCQLESRDKTKMDLSVEQSCVKVKYDDGNSSSASKGIDLVSTPSAGTLDGTLLSANVPDCVKTQSFNPETFQSFSPSENSSNTEESTTATSPETSNRSNSDMVKTSKKPKTKRTPKQPIPNPYSRLKTKEVPTFRFECICGVREDTLDSDLCIQCQECSGWQHRQCVNYNTFFLDNHRYLCPMCCVQQPAIPSVATLIVSPSSICHQWVDEINRHIQTHTLKILVYRGVKKQGFLQPRMLADHDIVITTYDTLRMELNYVDLPHTNSDNGRRLRHAKRYMAVPSPLPTVDWWRVCLDEAQMVECPTAKVAEMALRLTAVNRWCVTGTPIQNDLSNLYGLLLFLGMEPYWVKIFWDNILYKPFLRGNQEPMVKALAEVLWRSAKKDVIDQINIPAQTEQTHWLHFSPIETHFYKRKQEHCSKDLLYVAEKLKVDAKTRISSLARDAIQKLMNPLLKLRQACCHPQAVRGEFISMQRTTLTMTELMQSLTLKAKLESEEAHRQLVCALNGLAAVCIIKGETLNAVQFYRDVLHSAEEHKDRLKTDSLQKLHAMHNLHQLLQLKPDGLVPTLRDAQLEEQVQEIRDAYLAKAETALQTSIDSLRPLQDKITEFKSQLSPSTPWWLDGLQWVRYLGLDEELVIRVKDTLASSTSSDSFSVINHFSTLQGLQMTLVTKLDDLKNANDRLQAGMEEVSVDVTKELVAEATDCHLRPFGGKPKNRCILCRVHTLFTDYETCLFSIKQKDILSELDTDDKDNNPTGPKLQGSWAPSETEKILRGLLAFLRQHSADDEILVEGASHLEIMDVQKKEFKSIRVVWMMLCERVAAWDELKMATMRLRLRQPDEPEEITLQANVIEPTQVEQQSFKLFSDKVLAQSELKKKLGQLVYLKSLANAHADLPGGQNPELCPVCTQKLGKEWSVLPCGHSFCNACMDIMRTQGGSRRKTLHCAYCRSLASIQEISYVSTEPTKQQDTCAVPVKGGFSTKVEAVVRTLLQLREQDPNVKAIVFSTWVDVLTVIGKALRDNHVEFRSIGHQSNLHFKDNLLDFKHEEGVTGLLLPVHSGSKGLNIIEATHVLLVEPILNPASELQAVGRVHRIGQTRPTVVHRFIVRDTIEERLHAFLQANHTSDSLDNLEGETGALTLGNLKQLFTCEPVS